MASKFWLVWNVGGRAPTKKHTSQESARKEAERLAGANPGQEFAVLESVGACRTQTTVWEEHSAFAFTGSLGGIDLYVDPHKTW